MASRTSSPIVKLTMGVSDGDQTIKEALSDRTTGFSSGLLCSEDIEDIEQYYKRSRRLYSNLRDDIDYFWRNVSAYLASL